MPEPTEQVRATRRSAGLLHPFPRAVLAIRGPDRVRFLHNLLSHDIRGLSAGQQRPACLLDRQGKIIFFCIAHARPEELLLEMDPASLPQAQQQLEKYLISESAQIQDATDRWRLAAVLGPAAAALLEKIRTSAAVSDPPGFTASLEWPGLPGFTLWMDPAAEEKTLALLQREGQESELARCGWEAFDSLRIEAGIPWPGKEITPSVILNELGEQAPVSFTKGCYVGQEIVARIKYRAQPPRLLTGFLLDGDRAPVPESPLLAGSETVGIVTSACWSPTLEKPIALGFLKTGIRPGPLRAGAAAAAPVPLPFA